jgi:hypothetical protein
LTGWKLEVSTRRKVQVKIEMIETTANPDSSLLVLSMRTKVRNVSS